MVTLFLLIMSAGLLIYLIAGIFFVVGLFVTRNKRSSSKPAVSVIIAARNEEASIRECLLSVLNQTYPADLYEVIVINDRSSDKMGAVVEELMRTHLNLKLITIQSTPPGYSPKKWALQTGIEKSTGEIVLLTDADCTVKREWIETMVSLFTTDTGMVIGFSSITAETWFEKIQSLDFLGLMTCACGACNLGFPLSASGQNLAYRRKAFDEVNGFHSVKHRISGDDVVMVQMVRKKTTWKIVFSIDESAFSETHPVSTFKRLIQQRSRWASNATVMLKLNPLFLIYLSGVYMFHIGLVAGLFLSLFSDAALLITAFAWINKLIIDFMVISNGCRLFKRPFSAEIFLLWFLAQTPYVLWVGFKGAFGLFKWK